jgi:hypothetical protein
MQETKKGVSADQSRDRQIKERHSEATSKETLEDVEKGEKVSRGHSDDQSVPSPDGQPTERHEHDRADGSDVGGPM